MTQQASNQLILSESPQKAVQEVISIISDLQSVYEEETQALEQSRVQDFLVLQERKLHAAKLYETGLAQILERRDEMRGVDKNLKNKLTVMQQDFAHLAFQNKKALDRMRRMTARLGETIRDTAKNVIESRGATSYDAAGGLNKKKSGNMSVGISETA